MPRNFFVMARLSNDEREEFERVMAATGFSASESLCRSFAVGKSIIESAAMRPLREVGETLKWTRKSELR